MRQNYYGSGPDNAVTSATDSADGRWLSPIEDFLPAELAGTADPDISPDPGAANRHWVEAQSGTLYRFRVGAPAPQVSGNSTSVGSQPTSVGTSDGIPPVTNCADVGSS